MIALNKDKCFKQAEGDISFFTDKAALNPGWLESLAIICAKSLKTDETQLIERFNYHAGPSSNYSAEKNLTEGLQFIYNRLAADGSQALSDSEKNAIAIKLKEGAIACTAGFHNRVNDIVSGFQIPKTLDALLYQIRKSIIDATARKKTDEVHAHNRFSIVASSAGYGVKPLNWDDKYTGELSDSSIMDELSKAFNETYQPLPILQKLSEIIKGVLHSQFNYNGVKEEGYKGVDTFSAWLDYLKPLLNDPEWDPEDYLVLNNLYEVTDLNWKQINKSLFKALITQNYICCTQDEQAAINQILAEETTEKTSLDALFTQGLIDSPTNLKAFITYLGITSASLRYILILSYINKRDPSEKLKLLADVMDYFNSDKDLVAEINKYILNSALITDNDIDSFARLNASDPNQKKMISLLLGLFPHLDYEQKKKMLLIVNRNYGGNALMIAARFHPQAVEPILKAMSNLHVDVQVNLLTNKSSDGYNALMIAVLNQPQAVEPILEVISKLPHKFHEKYLPTNLTRFSSKVKMEIVLAQLTLTLAELNKKIDYFRKEGEDTAFMVASNLHETLQNSLNAFKQSERTESDIATLEQIWNNSTKNARPVLSKHRGVMKDTIPRLLGWIGVLIGSPFLAVNYIYEKALRNNQSYTLYSPMKTKSEQLIDKLEHEIKKPRKM